ncbi:hypothetical protein C0995_000872 [Termitomyces sp. Mi166|nr:hypothetical protein C0995_000872 [Termitomyces sp. Mi166\
MSTTPREIGTLIVVVLKANHLPNKRHIGKQDPYCLVTHNGEKRRTKAIKRGGQHPEWDEELRFTLYEDQSSPAANADSTPPKPPPKDTRGPKKVKGGWTMKIACFADDPREPDLIGEADVDLTEVLTKGETDEWFTLMNKDKFAGKVYLELTFWSNEPPPEKKVAPKPAKSKQYGGPGSFVPSGDDSTSGPLTGASHPSRIVATGSIYDHSKQSLDNIPSSLRASSSLAKLDLYVPPYERSVDTVANEFRDLGVSDHRRRESLPVKSVPALNPCLCFSFPDVQPPHDVHTLPSQIGYSTVSSHRSHGYDQSISEMSTYGYDSSPRTLGAQYQAPYRPQYESHSSYLPSARRPRHSIPTSSSGFMPLSNSSGYSPLPSHSSEPSVFGGHPTVYNASQFNSQPAYVSQTPAPDSYLVSSSSDTFAHQQSFQYEQYPGPQTYSTAPVQGQLPLVQAPPPQGYQAFATTPSPSHDAAALPHNTTATSSFSTTPNTTNSRPLPLQPQVVYTQPPTSVLYSAPPSAMSQPPLNSFTSSQPATAIYSANGGYQQPPPPLPPPTQYTVGQPQTTAQATAVPPPPPPPPSLSSSNSANRATWRQSSLPQPPVVYQQAPQPVYQPPPPPPLPPTDLTNHPLPPPPPPPLPHVSDQSPPYHPGPLPNPPVVVGSQGQWIAQTNYTQPGF